MKYDVRRLGLGCFDFTILSTFLFSFKHDFAQVQKTTDCAAAAVSVPVMYLSQETQDDTKTTADSRRHPNVKNANKQVFPFIF